MGLCLASCSEREDPVTGGGDDFIRVSASVDAGSRAQESGDITSGKYILSYQNTSNATSFAEVTFDEAGDESTYNGFPLINAEETPAVYRILRWSDVSNGSPFTLDNLITDKANKSVPLSGEYEASPWTENPTGTTDNDIIWGKISGATSGNLEFTLTHRMSKISVEIAAADGSSIDLSDISSVELTNVVTVPTSFNRENGNVSISEAQKETLDLGELESATEQSGDWNPSYTTKEYILPPQTFNFSDNTSRPELKVTVNNTTYSAPLNSQMLNENGDNADIPVTLAFQSGRHLTIRATLSRTIDDISITFLPAVVEKWEYKGEVGILAEQLGVYDEDDYADLVEAYNKAPKDTKVLSKYGRQETDGIWTFEIFGNIGDEDGLETAPKFEDDNFNLEFNNWSIYGISETDNWKESLIEQQSEEEEGGEV